MILIRGSSFAKLARSSAVLSVLPSSTKIICKRKSLLSNASMSRWYVNERTCSSLKHGMTTDKQNLFGLAHSSTRDSSFATKVFLYKSTLSRLHFQPTGNPGFKLGMDE